LTLESESTYLVTYPKHICFRYLLTFSTWPTIDIKETLFQCILLWDITVARMFWLSQSEERKNLAQPQNWASLSRNVSLENGQTDRLASPYRQIARGYDFMFNFMCDLVSDVVSTLLQTYNSTQNRTLNCTWNCRC
jgi:hypothetical protein